MTNQLHNLNTRKMTLTSIKAFAAHDKEGKVVPFTYEMTAVKEDEVVVKIACCGICHSDVHTIESGWGPADYPCVPGHEIIGHVVEKGPHASMFQIGDRVGVGAMYVLLVGCNARVWSCLECDLCKEGFDNLCTKRVFTYNAKYADGTKSYGGYAEHVKVNEKWAFAIPSELTDEEAAPMMCAGATVYAPLKRYITRPGMKVGIIGIGGLGHLAASKMGAEVTCISTSAAKIAESKQLGATHFYNVKDESQHAQFTMYFDLIINSASGGAEQVSGHLNMLRPMGTLCLLGVPEEKMSISAFEFVGQHRSITGSLIGTISEVTGMLAFAAKHGVKPWVQTMKMDKANEGIALMKKNQVKYRVVLKN